VRIVKPSYLIGKIDAVRFWLVHSLTI
jgi:hypothetical protein